MIRIGLGGTPKGMDIDVGLICPLLPRLHVEIGKLDLFVNDANFWPAINARQQLASQPDLLLQWQQDKAIAKSCLNKGLINTGDYSLFKGLWHKKQGLPFSQYMWKDINANLAAWPDCMIKLV